MTNKCIQTSCDCTGYKEPAQSKSSLLQFRLSCQECGHQASEHRKLTTVDHYIKSQVTAGKRSGCTARILPSEISLSPVFSRYDLIPIPRDDESSSPPEMHNSVQCTCKGFQLPDLIKLYQKFRTHSLSQVSAKLKDTPCSTCAHPLQSHAPPSSQGSALSQDYTDKKPLGVYESLSLRSTSIIPFPPINSNCLELMVPECLDDSFLLLSVSRSQGLEELSLTVASWHIRHNDTSEETELDKELSPLPEDDMVGEGVPRKRVKRTHLPGGGPSAAMAKQTRRSRRLAARKAREEEKRVLKQLKGLKGVGRWLREVELSDAEGLAEERELSEQEFKQVTRDTVGFVSHVAASQSYQTFCLPQELSDVDSIFPVMSALRITKPVSSQSTDESSMGATIVAAAAKIFVAVSTKSSCNLYVTVLPACFGFHQQPQDMECDKVKVEPGKLPWEQLGITGKGKLECVTLSEVASVDPTAGPTAGEVLVLAGMSCGAVCVWKVLTVDDRVGNVIPLMEFNCGSQCVVISCSPDKELLAVGTQLGEAVLSYMDSHERVKEEQVLLQRIWCSGAPIRCITWSQDGRMVAVGACDDAVQVLQCMEPSKAKLSAKGSIFQYFKPTTESLKQPKFTHTHTLKGHTSFIADLRFSQGYCLVTLGWDSQILFWKQLIRHSCASSRPKGGGRGRGERCGGPEAIEPVGGYKIGPAVVVEFLPLRVRTLMGCGLLVAMENKIGEITLAFYVRHP